MGIKVWYEWDSEQYEPKRKNPQIVDHLFQDKLADLAAPTKDEKLVLVRHTGNDLEGELSREWAYVDHTTWELPDSFKDSGDSEGAKVPVKFQAELEAWVGVHKLWGVCHV